MAVTYLGHVISENDLKPGPKKIQTQNFLHHRMLKIKQFLGLVGYYRRLIPNFSKMIHSLLNY